MGDTIISINKYILGNTAKSAANVRIIMTTLTQGFNIEQIPGGIQVKYGDNKSMHSEHVYDIYLSIMASNRQYVKYDMFGDKIQRKHNTEGIVVDAFANVSEPLEPYYMNTRIGYRFEVKSGMYHPLVSNNTVLFHNKHDSNLYLYRSDGKLISTMSIEKFQESEPDEVYDFEYHNTHSLLYSNPEDLTVYLWDHVTPDNNEIRELVCDDWLLFEYVACLKDQHLYIHINRENECNLIDVDSKSQIETHNNVHKFGDTYSNYRYYVTEFRDGCKRLIATDGYHVDMFEIELDKLNLVKSFTLQYMKEWYECCENGGVEFDGGEGFMKVQNGKLYFNKLDGVEQKEGTVYTNEFMCINLESIDSDGNYTEIPIIECLSDSGKELINTYYTDQEIIELSVFDANKFVLEFPDKKFVAVE